MALNQVSAVPAGVLRVISGWFLTPTPAFAKGSPTIFQMHMPSGMGTESLGIIGCIFADNGPLEGGIESSFSGTGWGAKGEFRLIFDPNPCICEGVPHHFPNAHALRYGHRKFGDHRMYIRGEWALRKWHWIKFQRYRLGGAKGDFSWNFYPNPCIFESGLHHFPNTHALRYRHKKFGDHRMYISGEWALRRWHWIKFQRYRLGC